MNILCVCPQYCMKHTLTTNYSSMRWSPNLTGLSVFFPGKLTLVALAFVSPPLYSVHPERGIFTEHLLCASFELSPEQSRALQQLQAAVQAALVWAMWWDRTRGTRSICDRYRCHVECLTNPMPSSAENYTSLEKTAPLWVIKWP